MNNSYLSQIPDDIELKPAHVIIACALVIITADLGLVSGYDAVLPAFLIAIIKPKLSPFLLLTITSIQDAPGMGGPAWYIAFTLVGTTMLSFRIAKIIYHKKFFIPLNMPGIMASVVVCYAIITSIIYNSLDIYPQSPEREPLMVGVLMIFMIWVGIESASIIKELNNRARLVTYVVIILLFHSLGIALLQMFIDPLMMVSQYGLESIRDTAQFFNKTALGIPRAHGTFLSPNAFALCLLLLYLVMLAVKKDKQPDIVSLLLWCVFGIILTVLSLSKAIAIYFILTSIILLMHFSVKIAIIGIITTAVIASVSVLFLAPDLLLKLESAFRLSSGVSTESYRVQVWNLVLEKFNWYDWILGTGLSHWPVLLEKNLGFSLSDPHTWVLSIPGTFGLAGLLFYFYIFKLLLTSSLSFTGNKKIIAIFMLVFFIVKDLFSIQYLLGNTPLSFLIWLILTLVLSKDTYSGQVLK